MDVTLATARARHTDEYLRFGSLYEFCEFFVKVRGRIFEFGPPRLDPFPVAF
jgi:hypothetical protein